MPTYKTEIVLDRVAETFDSWVIRANDSDNMVRGTMFRRLNEEGSSFLHIFFLNEHGILISGHAKSMFDVTEAIEQLYVCRSCAEIDAVEHSWVDLSLVRFHEC